MLNLKQYRGQAFTIPNLLSYLRFVLIPVFVLVFLQEKEQSTFYYWSLGVLFLSGLTDMMDGMIARKFNQITALGKLLDPLADKLTCIAVAICLCFKFPFVTYLAILYCVKEGAMILAGLWLLKQGKAIPGSRWFGKIATAVFYFSVILLVGLPVNEQVLIFTDWVVIINMCLIAFAFVMYLPIFWKLENGPGAEKSVEENQK